MQRISSDPLDRNRFPIDDWALVETEFDPEIQGRTETIFTVGNGYLGMRGNVDEARDGHELGTFVNGFHETWPIRHAEEAFGFAKVGQTIVNAPDAKIVRLYVDDEAFVLADADLTAYERKLDFRTGILTRDLVWRLPSGKRIRVRSRRFVSFTERHVAALDYEVTPLDDADVLISTQVRNRQDSRDELQTSHAEEHFDPRKAETITERVLLPRVQEADERRSVLGYRTANSGMTIAVAADHRLETDSPAEASWSIDDDLAKHVYRVHGQAEVPIRLTKLISYHTAERVPAHELAERCRRTLDRARELGFEQLAADQQAWLDDFWARTDVEIEGHPATQQAVRWNLLQIAQASARTDGGGIAAKGVTGTGYGGHYFWDTETYVMPMLSYTAPIAARNAMRFRQAMLPAARRRAAELNQRGALFPWRTINGEESSAYYAAGTAQYHIDADIAHALMQYVRASGDDAFLASGAIDILVETARMWADLGFWRSNGDDSFHIHGVTGPDEYTTVVNDNLFTNVMARANLRAAVREVLRLRDADGAAYQRMHDRLELRPEELDEWARAAEAMHVPYDEKLGVHPQDSQFLEKEVWDLEHTPDNRRPLLLHFHPLVIYRFQVLKQADVVLALLMQGDEFTAEEKLRDFVYYDALTTGDSTLSAVVQSIIAAEVGYQDLALDYFTSALYTDLGDLHRNAAQGVHVASTAGIWSALVFGFGGLRDWLGTITLDPRLPADWQSLTYRITLHGARVRVEVRRDALRLELETGEEAHLVVRGTEVVVRAGAPIAVPLEGQGQTIDGAPTTSDLTSERRADGSFVTASLPTLSLDDVEPGPDLP